MPAVLGYGTLAAVLLGAFDFTGGRLQGWNKNPEEDEFERKQYMRKNRRRPIEETIAEVGEGRGEMNSRWFLSTLANLCTGAVFAPGYQERRKERIKAAYGIDIPDSSL